MEKKIKDPRIVATDALEVLGTIHTKQEYRDAIHLAVEPVIAGERLLAGEDIGIRDGFAMKKIRIGVKPLGIVDPFIDRPIEKGESFFLIIYPGVITSLRHVWEHPQLDNITSSITPTSIPTNKTEKEKAYEWIESYVHDLSGSKCDVETFIEYAKDYYKSRKNDYDPDYLIYGGLFEGECISDEFWNNLEIYLGEKLEEEHRGSFISCSC